MNEGGKPRIRSITRSSIVFYFYQMTLLHTHCQLYSYIHVHIHCQLYIYKVLLIIRVYMYTQIYICMYQTTCTNSRGSKEAIEKKVRRKTWICGYILVWISPSINSVTSITYRRKCDSQTEKRNWTLKIHFYCIYRIFSK